MFAVTNVGSDDGVGGKGNTIIATVEDTCPGCDQNHIDFSVGSWNQLTNNAAFGTANIEWWVMLKSHTTLELTDRSRLGTSATLTDSAKLVKLIEGSIEFKIQHL